MANVKYQITSVDEPTAVEEARNSSRNTDTVFKRSRVAFCNSIFSSLILLIFTGLPIAMIVIGSIYKNRCPIERFIPLWLIIYGACATGILLFKALVNIVVFIRQRKNQDYKIEGINCFTSIISFFLFGWFIAGNYWVYDNHKKVHFNPRGNLNFYCDKLCYEFAFWSITTIWIIMGVGLMCCSVVSAVSLVGMCMAKKLNSKT